ncbi:NAD-dependent epimerase/dehydratase family protein [Ferruginivarius sediminum]|uniref:NAD-dependent epimerase/dehydratase family protein n=1 Tax=Ferruginivarius sediminum TaxID=2661937 RepID=A0A369TE78_9PROT|nr:NAD-dependent epimerase/dehydratase family protein [Ferruginivarius sediminum]RDD63570.1 NAD-dependent epimerase/dehydratase family protein [Ferruginivarius sediminum]
MRVLISGAAGLVGSHTAELLVDRGDTVLGIDNYQTGRRDNLDRIADSPSFDLIEEDIADGASIMRHGEVFRPDLIIHTAASYKDPEAWEADVETNTRGTANLVKLACETNVRRFIYFQTALCYGTHPQEQPVTLTHPINPANSSYAISKTAGENYIHMSGIDYVTFRLANVVGPRNFSGPLPIFFKRLSEGKQCFVTEARRDFVYVGDLVHTVMRAADGEGQGTYHFSSGSDVAIKELYDAVVDAMGFNHYPEPEVRPLGADDAYTILLDPSRTFEDFGGLQFTPLKATVERAIAYYRECGVTQAHTHLRHEAPRKAVGKS